MNKTKINKSVKMLHNIRKKSTKRKLPFKKQLYKSNKISKINKLIKVNGKKTIKRTNTKINKKGGVILKDLTSNIPIVLFLLFKFLLDIKKGEHKEIITPFNIDIVFNHNQLPFIQINDFNKIDQQRDVLIQYFFITCIKFSEEIFDYNDLHYKKIVDYISYLNEGCNHSKFIIYPNFNKDIYYLFFLYNFHKTIEYIFNKGKGYANNQILYDNFVNKFNNKFNNYKQKISNSNVLKEDEVSQLLDDYINDYINILADFTLHIFLNDNRENLEILIKILKDNITLDRNYEETKNYLIKFLEKIYLNIKTTTSNKEETKTQFYNFISTFTPIINKIGDYPLTTDDINTIDINGITIDVNELFNEFLLEPSTASTASTASIAPTAKAPTAKASTAKAPTANLPKNPFKKH